MRRKSFRSYVKNIREKYLVRNSFMNKKAFSRWFLKCTNNIFQLFHDCSASENRI